MVLSEAEVKSGNLVDERAVSAQIGGADLKREQTHGRSDGAISVPPVITVKLL